MAPDDNGLTVGGCNLSAWERTLSHAPIPPHLSLEARTMLREGLPASEAEAASLDGQRRICAGIQEELGARQLLRYPVDIEEGVIAGVPVRTFRPRNLRLENGKRVLMNCHGGAFAKDSGSLTENIPIAHLTQTTVVTVLYRMAPENAFPAAVDDAEAVYSELLGRYQPENIRIYGTSAGAILSAQTLVRLQNKGKPLPDRLGFFTGSADLGSAGDSEYFFPLVDDPRPLGAVLAPYIGGHDTRDPALSPIFADLKGFPATLCIAGTRDLMLSQTALFHRALLRAGVEAHLILFEGMPHAHWSYLELPESDEAFGLMANFLGWN